MRALELLRLLPPVLVGVWLMPSPAAADEVPIVYSRCPRGAKPFTVTGPLVKGGVTTMATTTVRNGDLVEMLPDTARPTSNFVAPCDLVYRDEKGGEKVLYSCIAESTPEQACAALDAAVSFDAKTVAFSVFKGPLARLRGAANGKIFDPAAENTSSYFFVETPGSALQSTESQIVLVDIASGKQTPLSSPPSTFNFGPAWLSNGRIAFSSAGRRPIYGPMPSGSNSSPSSIQLYAMDPDGRNVELVSPHAMAAELHPLQLTDGRVAMSSWQMFGMLAYRHGNVFGGPGTLDNFFHVYAQNPDGSSATALYGQHVSDPTGSEYDLFGTHLASHFLGQTSDGRVWAAEYYRANNLGLGSIVGFPIPPVGQEGPNPAEAKAQDVTPFRVPELVRLAAWAANGDLRALPMPAPPLTLPNYADPIRYAGKLGHPSGLPGNKLMVTWGVGPCTTTTGSNEINAMKNLETVAGDNPACDTGIYRTEALPANTPNPIKHPSELVLIVNSPDFHEFMARPVVPFKDVHGIDRPKEIPRAELASDPVLEHGTPFGVLAASSIIHRETKALAPIAYEWVQPALQGTDTIDYSDDELCGVRILAVHSNRKVESGFKSTSTVGERVSILGEFPVRKWDAAGKPVMDALGAPDTSFRVRFPADSPYLMQGIDCEGRTLNTDMTWQSLRPGEVKTCNGCHVHSSAATKLPFDTTWAASASATTFELGTGKVPLLAGGSGQEVKTQDVDGYQYMIEFDRDVMPILQARCVSCHAGDSAAAGLRLDVPRTWAAIQAQTDDSTYARLVLDGLQRFVPPAFQHKGTHGNNLGKPNLSKYVRMMNSRGSLLYWKAKNARTDNRTDAQFSDDVDFGADHPTDTTPDEVRILARWIDTGSGWGPELTQDTTHPVLHVVGVASGDSVTALRIGTADVGDGIDPDSLTACVIPKPGDACGPNLAGKAELAGVATVSLSAPLADPDAEVVVTVKDRSGNSTEGRYTVRFLLAQPPPSVTNQADGGADGGPDGAAKDGCSCSIGGGASAGSSFALFGILGVAALVLRGRARRSMGKTCLLMVVLNGVVGCDQAETHDDGATVDAGADAEPAISRNGPLAGLPSAPGPHIAMIKALGDDAWLNLGAPVADPKWGRARGRSWGGRALVLAPDLRGAFYTGEGEHAFVKPDGHIMDDFWLYDINANAWVAVYPGTDTINFNQQVKDGELLIDDNGQLVDKSGQQIPAHTMIHAWDLLTYDPDLRKLAFMGGDSLGRYYLGGEDAMNEGLTLLEAQKQTKPATPMSPRFYNTTTGKFERFPLAKDRTTTGGFPFFQYLNSRKQYFLAGNTGVVVFDPATNAWTTVQHTGTRPPGYDHGGCYDEKRDRVYMGSGTPDPTGALYIYDVKLAAWSKPAATGTGPQSFRTNDASIFYDAKNDVVTVFHYHDKKIYTYVPATDTWTDRPLPTALLTSVSSASFNAFYDVELNAYFVYAATDSIDNGVMWAYRYKQ